MLSVHFDRDDLAPLRFIFFLVVIEAHTVHVPSVIYGNKGARTAPEAHLIADCREDDDQSCCICPDPADRR